MTDHLTATLAEALRGAANYVDTLGGCSKSYRQVLARFDAAQQAVDPTDPGHEVEVLREHVRHLERRVRQLAGVQQAAGEQALPPLPEPGKTLLSLEDLGVLAQTAERNGTVSAFVNVAMQWAAEAHAEVLRLRAAQAAQPLPDECAATGRSCEYGPHGPKGEKQCRHCGNEPAAQPLPESATRTTLVRDEREAEQWLEANCGPRIRWTVEDVWYAITPAQLARAAQAAQPLPVREAWTVFGWVSVEGARTVFINNPENAEKLRKQGLKVVEVYTRAAIAQQPAPEAAKTAESVAQQYAREELARQMAPVYAAFAATPPTNTKT